ncbi:MAG: hypothetical protein IKD37_03395 [Clostridia bacterium]|nr:hypothetical protein [Clostridia bacterium]
MNRTVFSAFWNYGCRIFTAAALTLCLIQVLFATDEMVIEPLCFALLFPCALCISAAGMLFRSERISAGMRLLSHFAIVTFGVYLFVFWPTGVLASGRSALVLTCVYLLLYAAIMIIWAAIRNAMRRSRA